MGTKQGHKDFLAIATGVLLLLAMQPFFVWGVSNYLALLILILPIAPMALRLSIRNEKFLFAFFLVILFTNAVFHGYSFLFLIYLIMFVFIPFCSKSFSTNTFATFRIVISIVFAVSLIEYFVVVFGGIDLPNYTLAPLNELKPYTYTAYPPFLVRSNSLLDTVRFCSAFDEPGVVGTVCMLIMYVEDYKLKDPFNIIILIAGIFSFSFFFYLGSLLYLGIRYGRKNILYVLLFLVVAGVFYVNTKDNPVLDELVYSRFSYDEDRGTLAGINRSSKELDDYYSSVRGTWGYFFGDDSIDFDDYGSSSSYKTEVLRYGMVFCTLYVIFFLALARKRNLSFTDFLLLCVMVLGTLYQRPKFFDVVFVFLFSQFIVIHSQTKEKKNVCNSNHSLVASSNE